MLLLEAPLTLLLSLAAPVPPLGWFGTKLALWQVWPPMGASTYMWLAGDQLEHTQALTSSLGK